MKGVLVKQVRNFNLFQRDWSILKHCGDEFSIRTILLFGLSATFLAFINEFNRIDLDLFHQIALFREIMKTGTFPQKDIFSYTSTVNPVIHHEWGTGAILYFLIIKPGFGEKGLLILKYLLTFSICSGVYIFAKRQGAGIYTFSFVAFWGILLGRIGFTTIRAQVFSLMFLILFLFLIEENRKGSKWPLVALLPLYTIWVNVHGGFLIGLGLFITYVFELFLAKFLQERDLIKSFKDIKYQLLIIIALCFSTFINPYGISYISTIFDAIALDRTPIIREWRPVFQVCHTTFYIFILSLVVILYAWHCQNNFLILPGTFLLIVSAWQALCHYRHLSIYSVLLVCYVPALLEKTDLCVLLKSKFKKIFCFLFIAIGLLGIITASYNKFWQLRIPTLPVKNDKLAYPVGAVRYLKDKKFTGNVIVGFHDGAYVSWNLFPRVKVSLDSRFEAAYSLDQVTENMDFYEAREGWQNILQRYQTDAILVPNWKPIEKVLGQDKTQRLIHFKKVYIDKGYSIYMRSDLATKYPFIDMQGEKIVGAFP